MMPTSESHAHNDTGPRGRADTRAKFVDIRAFTEALIGPLRPEDMAVQSMPDVSPTKWHLAHTSWFFEAFVLCPLAKAEVFHPRYHYLFNSYYEAAGPRHPRAERGLITRPDVDEVMAYRAHVTGEVAAFIETAPADVWAEAAPLIELGLHHEQQHQELILMDIKHVLSQSPLRPSYTSAKPQPLGAPRAARFLAFSGGLHEIGHDRNGFAFDNEAPRHKVWLEPFTLSDRLVTCGQYLEFIDDGGYRRPDLWLSDGWAQVTGQHWTAPLYWRHDRGQWRIFTLTGERAVDPAEPVVHVSHYEADAFARWAGARLPTEAEWETAAVTIASNGTAKQNATALHPRAAGMGDGLQQMIGEVWQWTASAYLPYPRFRPAPGAVGEYNGKFMSGQMVLRGGCVATPPDHIRATYRNFFPPGARWCFGGIRLAGDA